MEGVPDDTASAVPLGGIRLFTSRMQCHPPTSHEKHHRRIRNAAGEEELVFTDVRCK